MNLIVLSLTCVFWKSSVKWQKFRMVAASLLGAGLSAFFLVILQNYLLAIAVTFFSVMPVMLLFAFGAKSLRQFLLCLGTSLFSTVVLRGTAEAVFQLTGIRTLNFYVCLVVLVAARYVVKSAVSSVKQQKRRMEVTLTGPGGSISCLGFYDSGNLLSVPESGEPVHIIAPELMHRLLGETRGEALKQQMVAFHTLGADVGWIQVYQIPSLTARQGNCCYRIEPAWVGLGRESLMKGKNYQIILNAAVTENKGKSLESV